MKYHLQHVERNCLFLLKAIKVFVEQEFAEELKDQ
jgi:hypothetical protein